MPIVCTRMSLGCHSYLPVCHQYVTRIHSYVNCMYSYVIRISLACNPYVTRMSFICHSYVLVCFSYVTRIHSYVIRTSLVCHPYVTRMYSYVVRMLLVCDFTMIRYKLGIHGFVTRLLVGTFVTSVWYFGILFKLHLTVRFSSCSLKLLFYVNFKGNGFIIICKSFLQRYK